MRLTTTTQLSVDGVMQAPGVNVGEEEAGFERRGWAHFDDEAGAAMDEIFRRAGAFLLGRRTYELFASTWGSCPTPAARSGRRCTPCQARALDDARQSPVGRHLGRVRRPGGARSSAQSGARRRLARSTEAGRSFDGCWSATSSTR